MDGEIGPGAVRKTSAMPARFFRAVIQSPSLSRQGGVLCISTTIWLSTFQPTRCCILPFRRHALGKNMVWLFTTVTTWRQKLFSCLTTEEIHLSEHSRSMIFLWPISLGPEN